MDFYVRSAVDADKLLKGGNMLAVLKLREIANGPNINLFG